MRTVAGKTQIGYPKLAKTIVKPIRIVEKMI
jgi:hypothetical protein